MEDADASSCEPPSPAGSEALPGSGSGTRHAPAEIIDASRRLSDRQVEWLTNQVNRAIDALGCRGEVRVRVVGDDEMARTHQRYAGMGGTTDVLTFDLGEGSAARTRELDVDVFVCVDEASRQASERGHEVERELLLYVLHGVLHCLGHDDHDEASAAAMHAREDEVLERIGVGATFGGVERG